MADSHREEIAKLEALYAGNPGGRVFVHLAEAYRKAGEHERARRILDEGLGRHPDSASGYVVLGRVLADMQVTGEAETAFRRVLELDGGNLVALRWLGDIARQAGRNADAAMHYRELLIRNPSNEEVRDLVEIVEREAAESAPAAAPSDRGGDDAFASFDDSPSTWDSAVAQPSEEEQPAVSSPGAAGGTDAADWSAAPGHTADAQEVPVEFGLVDLDTAADHATDADGEETPPSDSTDDPDAQEQEPQETAWDRAVSDVPAGAGSAPADDSELVASTGGDGDVLELDELRRDDESEPVEIHLLDPAWDPSGDEEEYAGELDLTDLAPSNLLEDADDYADETFVADLSGAGTEEPDPDELPGDTDVLDASLTLLPGDDAADDVEREGGAAAAADLAEADYFAPAGDLAEADHFAAADAFVGDVAEAGGLAGTGDLAEAGGLAGAEAPSAADGAEAAAAKGAQEYDSDLELYSGSIFAAEPEAVEAEAFGSADAPDAEPADAERSAFDEPVVLTSPDDMDAGAESSPEGDDQQAEPQEDDAERTDYAELAGAAAPAAESEPAVAPREPESGLVTETMAVLYRSQGFHDRAADVYRALLRTRPHDERLAAKLREAEEAARSTARHAPAGTEDDAGEVWLRGVGAAWTGQDEAAQEDATPYAWAPEDDDAEAGEPIGSYLQDLVSWKAGAKAWIQPDTRSAGEPAGDIEMPDWLNGPGESEPWTPDSTPDEVRSGAAEAGPDADSMRAPAPPEEETPGWMQQADATASDAWDAAPGTAETGPVQEETAAWESADAGDQAAEPVDAADQAEEHEAAGSAYDAAPWEQPDADAGGTAADESGGGWTPFELDRDVPPAAPAAEPAEAPLPGLQDVSADDESSDDDDLEMFRSWLQSLKK